MELDQKYPYHTLRAEETLEKLSASKEGLSSDEAKKRQEEFGKNVLPEKGKANPIKLFFKQFKDFLVFILIIAAGVAFWADQMVDVYIIGAVILFNATMGFIQEYKAEQAIESIKSMIQKKAVVLRDGTEKELPAEEVVPGDIILLNEGQAVPADGRLLSRKELRTSEAALTGESMPVDKDTEPLEEENEALGDRVNMVWKGTNVAQGKGKAVVTAIGEQTEIGKIATSMSEMEMQDSNFRKKTSQLGKVMAVIAIVTSAIVFAIGYWFRDYDFQAILLVTIATLVSSIPEGLPAVISIVLAIGANRMAKQNVIIREFTATEMMGSVSVILSDKTGTITQSILTVKKVFTGSGEELAVTGDGYQLKGKFEQDGEPIDLEEYPVERKLLTIAAFCNSAHLGDKEQEETPGKEAKKEPEQQEKEEDKKEQEQRQREKEHREEQQPVAKVDEGEREEAPAEKSRQEEKQPPKTGTVRVAKEVEQEEVQKNEDIDVNLDVQPDRVHINISIKKDDTAGAEPAPERKPAPGAQGQIPGDRAEEPEGKEEEPAAADKKDIDIDLDVKPDSVRIDAHLKKKKDKAADDDIEEEEEEEEEIEEEDEEEDEDEGKNEKDEKSKGPKVVGDPTEAAMFVMARKAHIRQQEPYRHYRLVDDLPFNSEQKFRASLVDTGEGAEIYAIGAPERILELSSQWLTPDGPEELTEDKREEIREKMDEWTGQAMRVLAQAYKAGDSQQEVTADDVQDLVWVGITGIIDPPREGVRESVEECKEAGIRVMMVTGDHKKTAAAIAKQVAIVDRVEEEEGAEYPVAITGKELDVEDEKFDDYIEHVSVFARMDPDTKLRIAERLQRRDTLIAMTGDGVNDAPALKRADVGIAMGQRGTDVAKDAAEIVLQDDNFSSIVNAIREGRIVFNNIRITSYFLLTTNFAFVTAFIIGMSIGFPLLLTAVQILYVNLVTSGIMDVALATEPGHGEIMKQPPLKKSEGILKWDIVPFLLLISAIIVALALFTFRYYLPEGEVMARTGTFVMVSMTQIFNVFNMRSLRKSIFEIGPLTNFWVNLAFLAAIVLQYVVIKVPFLREVMRFEDLPTVDFLVMMLIATVVVWAGELYKYIRYKKNWI